MSEDRNEFPAVTTAFIVGALAGAVVGLLLAPKSGRETREDLKEMGRGLGDKASRTGEAARHTAEEWFDRAATAVGAAKRAYKETRNVAGDPLHSAGDRGTDGT